MSNEKVAILNFSVELNEDGSLNLPQDKFAQLFDQGYRSVELVALGDPFLAGKEKGIDKSKLSEMIDKQKIPASTALKFLKSKGKFS